MTERGRSRVAVEAGGFTIGPSRLAWDGRSLVFDIAETAVPIPRPVRGRVVVTPRAITGHRVVLNETGRHVWWPIAPCCDVTVEMAAPAARWSGTGYLDCNRGAAPIADGFSRWTWSRAATGAGATILYGGTRRDGSVFDWGWRFDASGTAEAFAPPPSVPLPKSGWRIARATPSEGPAAIVETLEDTPFYARSLVRSRPAGAEVTAVHESLSLDRFRSPVVQAMLPFRMPRRA